jgi:hypothetical protein
VLARFLEQIPFRVVPLLDEEVELVPAFIRVGLLGRNSRAWMARKNASPAGPDAAPKAASPSATPCATRRHSPSQLSRIRPVLSRSR